MKENKNLDARIRNWMLRFHPAEKEMIGDFSKTVTFREVIDRMERGEDFYEICNCTESQEREFVFWELVRRTGKPYDYWYDLWLGNGKESK